MPTPDPLQSPPPPPTTWARIFGDPNTTLAGFAAAVGLSQVLPWSNPWSWLAIVAVFLSSALAADKKLHSTPPTPAKEPANGTAS